MPGSLGRGPGERGPGSVGPGDSNSMHFHGETDTVGPILRPLRHMMRLTRKPPPGYKPQPDINVYNHNKAISELSPLAIMTPGKAKLNQHRPQVVPQASDYESDINYLSDIPPPPTDRTDEELNLAVLKRHNPSTISLEHVTPYTVVYLFSPTSQQWEKSGIEGTAFICGLSPQIDHVPRYSVTVLNRRGLENFNIELLSSNDVEVTEEYIILQSTVNGVPQVYGLWVFCEPPPSSTSHHRAATAHKILECAARVATGKRLVQEQCEDDHDDDEIESVPMDRQLSLKELFGQQRQQDDAWSVRSHSPHPSAPQFTTSVDTDFFHNTQRHSQLHSQTVSSQSINQGHDSLLSLFRKAGESYRGSSQPPFEQCGYKGSFS